MAVRYPSAFSGRSFRSAMSDYPNVLEIPSAYEAPTRGDVVRRFDNTGGLPCDCNPRGQGGGPKSGPQNPYAMPGPQPLGEPSAPQKPFQTPASDPCQMNDEILTGLGLDPDCLRGGMRKSSTRKASAKRKSSSTKLKKRRSQRKLTTKQLFPKARATTSTGRYRKLSNGACYDTSTRKFVKKSNC